MLKISEFLKDLPLRKCKKSLAMEYGWHQNIFVETYLTDTIRLAFDLLVVLLGFWQRVDPSHKIDG